MGENTSNGTIPVHEFPTFIANVEKQINNEIRQVKEQIKLSRELRLGVESNDSVNVEDTGTETHCNNNIAENVDTSLDLINVMNNIIALLDQSVRQYNQAMAIEAETAAAVLEDISQLLTIDRLEQDRVAAKLEEAEGNAKVVVGIDSSQSNKTPQTCEQQSTLSTAPCVAVVAEGLFKAGMLLNNGKDRMFNRTFSNNYVVISDGKKPGTIEGIAWYESETHFNSGKKPIDFIPFYVINANSRGSRFKKAAVCWPLITTAECPKINDKSRTYFGIDYYNEKSKKSEIIVLGAETPEERDEWVYFITIFIALFIPPGEKYIQFSNMKVGCGEGNKPMHINEVVDGEAPGSSQRVVK